MGYEVASWFSVWTKAYLPCPFRVSAVGTQPLKNDIHTVGISTEQYQYCNDICLMCGRAMRATTDIEMRLRIPYPPSNLKDDSMAIGKTYLLRLDFIISPKGICKYFLQKIPVFLRKIPPCRPGRWGNGGMTPRQSCDGSSYSSRISGIRRSISSVRRRSSA